MKDENTHQTFRLRGASWNKVYILESLQEGDRHLGFELHNTMVQENATGNWVKPFYRYCHGKSDFLEALERIRLETETDETLPLIHLEMHGGPGGLQFESRESISYIDLVDELRRINRACGNNLIVVLAVCFSGHLAMAINPTIHAPFHGIVASFNKPTERAVREFHTFYTNLYRSQSMKEAVDSLNRFIPDDQHFRYFNAEAVFLQITTEFRKHHESEIDRERLILKEVTHYRESEKGRLDPRSDQELFARSIQGWSNDMLEIYKEMRERFMGITPDDESVSTYEAQGPNYALHDYYERLQSKGENGLNDH